MPRASCHSAPRRPAAAPRPPGRAGHAVAAAFRARRRVIFSKIRIVRASESDRGHGTVRVRVGCTDMLTDQAACGSTITAGFPRPLAAPPTTRSLTEAAWLANRATRTRCTGLPRDGAASPGCRGRHGRRGRGRCRQADSVSESRAGHAGSEPVGLAGGLAGLPCGTESLRRRTRASASTRNSLALSPGPARACQ